MDTTASSLENNSGLLWFSRSSKTSTKQVVGGSVSCCSSLHAKVQDTELQVALWCVQESCVKRFACLSRKALHKNFSVVLRWSTFVPWLVCRTKYTNEELVYLKIISSSVQPKTPDGIFVDRDRDKKEAVAFHFWFASGVILWMWSELHFHPLRDIFTLESLLCFGSLVMVWGLPGVPLWPFSFSPCSWLWVALAPSFTQCWSLPCWRFLLVMLVDHLVISDHQICINQHGNQATLALRVFRLLFLH